VRLAGIPIRDKVALELARELRDAGFDETAETLEVAHDAERSVVDDRPLRLRLYESQKGPLGRPLLWQR
jgi:hypothetical protein